VQSAPEHPILLNAILAISAKHLSLSLKENIDALTADRYQGRCLNALIPVLAREDTALDGGLICAVIMILRLYDEMTGEEVEPSYTEQLLNFHSPCRRAAAIWPYPGLERFRPTPGSEISQLCPVQGDSDHSHPAGNFYLV
jgi:hypothetical protein